jgi:D-alanine-D-alanine ligase
MNRKLRVAVLANIKTNAPHWEGMPKDRWADLDSEKTVNALVEAVRSGGYEAEFLEGDVTLLDTIRQYKPDICFNICEGHYGDAREAQVPALLEMLHIPYTGSRVLTLALALDKPMTKRILHWHELPTPAFQCFERADEPLNDDMNFPLFVKPSSEGTGMGVSAKSVVQNETELREQVDYIVRKYQQTALVEDFIEGREVTVGLLGNLEGPVAQRLPDDLDSPRIQAGLRFLPPMEVDLDPYRESDVVYSNRLKSEIPEEVTYLCPAPLTKEQLGELNWLAAAVFRVLDGKDVSRIDFRLDMHDNWKPYILEINPLPGLSPGISDIVIEAAADGINHTELVHMILNAALKRYGLMGK